jgi:nucleoside-diphosphate-sugar epimerase
MSLPQNTVCAITGASGYVGSILTNSLKEHMPVVRMVRRPAAGQDIQWSFDSSPDDTARALRDRRVSTLVHAAWDMSAPTFQQLNQICVKGSAALFEAAALAGVERIVFISTISAFPGCRSHYGATKLSVETMLASKRAVILRPGLVFGGTPGGVFGGLKRQVSGSRFLPMIGDGSKPQYLLHEKTLAETVLRAVNGNLDHVKGEPIVLAHPKPWPFRELMQNIAAAENRKVTLVPIPWQLLFHGMRMGERLNIKLPFRSDSVTSFVYASENPDFTLMRSLGINPIPFLAGETAKEACA